MERRQLLSGLIVQNSDDSGPNSLRWAIQQADAGLGAEIDFQIPGDGPMSIVLQTPLPSINVPISIDGTTQPGYVSTPMIEIDGSGLAGGGVDGLVLSGGSSTIRGLSLVGFSGAAIVLESGGGNVVASNYLGLDPSGAVGQQPNGQGLVLSGSSSNTIGAGPAGLGNVISGNSGDGILLQPGAGVESSANMIVGNLVGTSLDGMNAIGNGGEGIDVQGGASNTIGMAGKTLGNVISGNTGAGIGLSDGATGVAIQNNMIGVAIDGQSPLGNQSDGIQLDDAPGTTVGGSDASQRNIIGANAGNGISALDGSDDLLVAGNAIGTDATGQLELGNQQNGILLGSSSCTVGGTIGGGANFIENNGGGLIGAGVQLSGMVIDNTILTNAIDGNAGLGINFGSGPTPTHNPGTPGPNDFQNYPLLSSAVNNGMTTTISGSLFESPNTSYLLQFFSIPQRDPSGYGQGQTYLGSTSVETNATGNGFFQYNFPSGSAVGSFVSATATSPTGDTSEFSADLQVQSEINLVVTGTAAPNPVASGSDVTYTLDVSNVGTANADSVMLSDAIPTGFTVVSASVSQGFTMPTTGPGDLAFELLEIPAGGSATVTIVARAGAPGTALNVASVSSEETDPYPSSEQVTIPVTVLSSTDLSVTMTEGPTPVLVGGDQTYTITTKNLGSQAAPNAIVTLPVAEGLTFVSAGSTAGTAALQGSQVVAELGTLAPGEQAVVTVVFQAVGVGAAVETATATCNALDTGSSNVATVSIDVLPASDLSVAIASNLPVAATGLPLTYTLTVSNAGPIDATSVVVTDTLPMGATLVSATTNAGVTPTVTGGIVSVSLATLATGTSATITILVDPTVAPGSTLLDSATVQGAQADPVSGNNQAQISVGVRGVSDLSVVATSQPPACDVGQPITYTITATNTGPADEPDAVLGGLLPTDMVIVSASSTQGKTSTVVSGLLTTDLGTLASGSSAVVTLVAIPGPADFGTLSIPFSLLGQNYDGNLANNTATATVAVSPSADLGVQIMTGSANPVAQVPWSFTVLVTNAGPSAATGVVATIPLPAGTTFDSASASQGSAPGMPGLDGGIGVSLGTIASGDSATIRVVVTPMSGTAGGSIALSAQADGDEDDPNSSNNVAAVARTVAPSVNVALALRSPPQAVQTGQVFQFTASVFNAGSTTATGVVVAFPMVSGLQYLDSSPSQGITAVVSSQSFGQIGNLAPGVSASVTVQEMAMASGLYTMTASVAEDQYNLDASAASATATAQVLESPGTIELGTGSLQVTDLSGVAIVPVYRLYGAAGTVTVQYQTSPINAAPGVDFTPTSGTLTLGPGQWTGSIAVPILNDPYLNHDTSLNLTIVGPTGGASLGPTTTALVHIQDANPDTTPPRVTGLTWSGTSKFIQVLTLQFSEPLDPSYATNPADYRLSTVTGGQGVGIASISYDPSTFSVTIVPASPIRSGQYDRIQVVGTGATAIRDLAGNFLNGNGNGLPGSDYVVSFAQGKKLRYFDGNRNLVRLAIRGRGYLEQVLDAEGNGIALELVGMAPHRTTLTGHLKAGKGGSGQTQIGQVVGLGQFGDVRVLLKTPPFLVTQFPFQRRGKTST